MESTWSSPYRPLKGKTKGSYVPSTKQAKLNRSKSSRNDSGGRKGSHTSLDFLFYSLCLSGINTALCMVKNTPKVHVFGLQPIQPQSNLHEIQKPKLLVVMKENYIRWTLSFKRNDIICPHIFIARRTWGLKIHEGWYWNL